jgi:two-component system nitrate/nitrite response regulator NarP
MKLLIADDHRIVLEGIHALLRGAGYTITARCTDGEQVLNALEAEEPDIMVLDVQMPQPTGIDILRLVKEQRPGIRVILLTSSINNAQALESLRLGVNGLILKEAASKDLLECVRTVAEGRQWLDPAAARLALDAAIGPAASHAASSSSLTPREIEVVRHIALGHRNKEIARELQISEGTVKMHLHRVYEKLGVTNRTQLCVLARDRGIV